MLLTPRYGDQPVLTVEPRSPGPHPILQQRRRLEAVLATFTEEDWRHPSRCEGWTAQDVVTHLVSTNGFWALSIQAGLAGDPTRFLGAFDPVATPAQLVDQVQGTPPADTLDQLVTSNAALAAVVEGLGDADWDVLAEAPPGHLPIRLVADHALWDGWVHERDILLPLGRPAVVEADEVLASLCYSVALGRAFEACAGSDRPDPVGVVAHDPDVTLVVRGTPQGAVVQAGPVPAGAPCVEGDAVELLEMVSTRDVGRPAPPAMGLLTAGLATVFDQT